MHKYLSLTKTLMKSGFALEDGKLRKAYRLLLYLILLIAIFRIKATLFFPIQ